MTDPAPATTPRYHAVERAVFAGLGGGDGVIVDSQTALYYGLNRTAAFLWERLRQSSGATAEALARAIVERFAVDEAAAIADVIEWLRRAEELGLVRRAAA